MNQPVASPSAEYVAEIRRQIVSAMPIFYRMWNARNFVDVTSDVPEARGALRFHVTISGVSGERGRGRAFFVQVILTQADLYDVEIHEWFLDEDGIPVRNAAGQLSWVVYREEGLDTIQMVRDLQNALLDVR